MLTDDLAGRGLERADELPADDLALGLGVGHAVERGQERVGRVDHLQVDPGRGDEVTLDLLGLALAEQSVIDEHAGELIADRALNQRGGHRGVDSPGQPADHPTVAHLPPDGGDRVVDDVRRRPVGAAAGDVVEERLQDELAGLAVLHLGVPLHAGESALGVLEGGDRGSGAARPGR